MSSRVERDMEKQGIAVESERVPLSSEQIDALDREFNEACFILDWRKSRRTTRDVAHKAFRDLVVTVRADREVREEAARFLEGYLEFVSGEDEEHEAKVRDLVARLRSATRSGRGDAQKASERMIAKKSWRCFFCDEVFTREQDAREHFGAVAYSEAACQIKGHEGGLVEFIRQQERELAKYRAEVDPLTRTIEALRAESAVAIRTAEEDGYGKGVTDTLAQSCPECVAKVRGPVPDGTDWSQPVPALAMRDAPVRP